MKTNIKKIMLSSLIVLSAGFFSSCTDDLKEKTYAIVTPEVIPDSNAGADLWVIGTYSKLCNDMFRYAQLPNAIEFDNDYITGPDWAFADLGAGNFQSSGAGDKLKQLWSGPYTIIRRANVGIKYINEMQNVTEVQKNNNLGELYFLKAWSYFMLTRAFGEVPIFPDASTETGIYRKRESIPDVYAHIIALLKDAEIMMYKNTDPGFKAGRASAGAAASLLSKVYLTMASGALSGAQVTVQGGAAYSMSGTTKVFNMFPVAKTYTKEVVAGYEGFNSNDYFVLARDKAKEVIDGTYGTYDLIYGSYASTWSQANKNKTEHIWSLQSKVADPVYGNSISKYFSGQANPTDASRMVSGLWAGMRRHWYTLFESTDLRIVDGVLHTWKNSSGTTIVYPPVSTVNSLGIAYTTKYYQSSDRTQNYGDINYPFLRFADILLIYAEAQNEVNGPVQEALDPLNKVRTRSSATAKVLSDFASKQELRSFILEERARELACEGDRRWDLIRWGIYLPVMNAIGIDENGIQKTRFDRHRLYPIPTAEVLSNPLFNSQNNPGWN